MTADVRQLLPLYVLGLLEPDEVAVVERALRADAALAAELLAYDDAAARLIATVEPMTPPPAVRARLLASIGPSRFERFVNRFAQIFDVAAERARELMTTIDDAAGHDRSIPGAVLVHFEGGPAVAGADCGFILLPAGKPFPWHRHDGEERVLVLQGTILEGGRRIGPGEEDVSAAGTEHEFVAAEGDDLIFCARVWGVDFTVPRPS